jgi:hypothetical protein
VTREARSNVGVVTLAAVVLVVTRLLDLTFPVAMLVSVAAGAAGGFLFRVLNGPVAHADLKERRRGG